MKHATTRALFAYWNQVRGTRAAPERDDIDPTRLRHYLGDVFILDLEQPGRPVFRLAGSRICGLAGRDVKALPFADLWIASDRPRVANLMDSVVDAAVVAVVGVRAGELPKRLVHLELSLLPLRHRGRTHARMLGSLSAIEPPDAAGHGPVGAFSLDTVRFVTPGGWQDEARRGAFLPDGGRQVGKLVVYTGGRAT
jgi:hypothetical protein